MLLPAIVGRFVAVLVLASLGITAASAQPRAVQEKMQSIALVELPREARETLTTIRAGGPFAYERDGVRFGNRERLLPARERDYYREYTVRTPGVRTRGARRLVCGGAAKTPEVCYYTDDHYTSFRRIRE